jgi:hypothetical protein
LRGIALLLIFVSLLTLIPGVRFFVLGMQGRFLDASIGENRIAGLVWLVIGVGPMAVGTSMLLWLRHRN